MKVGDRVTMKANGRKAFPRLKSYTGIVEDMRQDYKGWEVKIRRAAIVYRGETGGHWWSTIWWKKEIKRELTDFDVYHLFSGKNSYSVVMEG